MDVVEHRPGGADIVGAKHAEVGADVQGCGDVGTVECNRVAGKVKLDGRIADGGGDVGPGRPSDGGTKDMAGLGWARAVEASQDGVEDGRVGRIEFGAGNVARRQVARDVGEGWSSAERIGGHKDLAADSDDDVISVDCGDVDISVGGEGGEDAPGGSSVEGLPEILVAAGIDVAGVAGIGGDGKHAAVLVAGGAPRSDLGGEGLPVVGGDEQAGAGRGRPEAAGSVDRFGGDAVIGDVEAIGSLADPIRADGAGGGLQTVVLRRADDDAGGGVGLDVDVEEEPGLEASEVERVEGGSSVGRGIDASVVAAEDNRRCGAGLRDERPRVRVRVEDGDRGEACAGVRGFALRDGPEINDVVQTIAGRGRIDRHVEAVAALGSSGHAGGGLLRPGCALILTDKDADGILRAARAGSR